MFTLEFSTDNAAFDEEGATMTGRILRDIAGAIEDGQLDGRVWDPNGNAIGFYSLNGDSK